MTVIPKALQKVIGKIDPRAKPDPNEVKKFKEGAGRRYMNVGISTKNFYAGIAEQMKDKELRECAIQIKQAVYDKNDMLFRTYTVLFQSRMGELGVWKSVKGIGGYQKAKVMGRIAKLARTHQRKVGEGTSKQKKERGKK